MPGGEAFTQRDLGAMTRAVRTACDHADLVFSVYVGASEGPPAGYADRLLTGLGDDAARGVVVLVDPTIRRVEIATGHEAARRLDDRSCGLAALSMTSSFSGGDLVGGIVTGLRMLGESVAAPAV